ncbi:MAG: hypothetical protein HYT94_04640 [Parcubacteria group bacterium]|nr:hypothetical protein [Parcubacteria group bacterium]
MSTATGRTARLLLNLLLLQEGYPAAIIRPEDRREYLNSLEKAQTLGEKEEYYAFMLEAIERSIDMYLEALGTK